MIRSIFIFSMFLSTLTVVSFAADNKTQGVNAIIGDISFVSRFGFKPTHKIDEILRIKTHLEFVENLLRSRDTDHLTEKQKTNRTHLLDLLHTYWMAEIFPRNFDYEGQRVSCFIDSEERICAVGFLIEQTAGRDVAEEINARYKYSNVMDMNHPIVSDWIASSGLTKKECAMIQPTYGWENPYTPEPLPVELYPGAPALQVLYVVDMKKQLKLEAEIDSQKVVLQTLHNQVDSLNVELAINKNSIDSLTTSALQKEEQLTQSKNDVAFSAEINWVLGSLLVAGIIAGIITWLRITKAKRLKTASA